MLDINGPILEELDFDFELLWGLLVDSNYVHMY